MLAKWTPLLLWAAVPVMGATITVPTDQPTIQAGINAAATGDEVVLLDGTYSGVGNRNVDFLGKAITVRSLNGPGNCVVDCQSAGRAFVFASGETAASRLVGLTISNGRITPAGDGGAILCVGTSPEIEGCVFSNNVVDTGLGNGGAIAVTQGGSPAFIDCEFAGNSCVGATGGGAIYLAQDSCATISGCEFSSNIAYSSFRGGGAIFAAGSAAFNCAVGVSGCLFSANLAVCGSGSGGGAVSIEGGAYLIEDSIFLENETRNDANCATAFPDGGAIRLEKTQGAITECNFVENLSVGDGGALWSLQNGLTTITSTRFIENESDSGGGVFLTSRFQDSVRFVCCKFTRNIASESGGGLFSVDQIVRVLDSVFENNRAGADLTTADCNTPVSTGDGGAIHVESSEFCLANTVIVGNTASNSAGGLLLDNAGPVFVTNCVFGGNQTLGNGGALLNDTVDAYTLNNCTFGDNLACANGGAIHNLSTSLKIHNNIIWSNGAGPVSDPGSGVDIINTLIEGGWSGAGSANIDADPRFADPAAYDFRVARCSPAVSAGDPNLLPLALCDPNDGGDPNNPLGVDLTGGPRVIDSLDLGAYEFMNCPGDVTGNQMVDLSDLSALLASFGRSSGQPGYEPCAEFNGDAMVALEDLAELLANFGNDCGGCIELCSAACSGEEESLGGGSGQSELAPGAGGGASASSGPAVTLEVDAFDTSGHSSGDFDGETDDFVFDLLITVNESSDDWTSNGGNITTSNGAVLRLAPYDPNDPNSDPEPTGAGEPNRYVCFVGVPKPVSAGLRFTLPGASYAGGFNGGDEFTYTTNEFDVAWFDTSGTSHDGPAAVMRIVIDVSGVSGADTSSGFGSVYYSETGPAAAGDIEVATFEAATGVASLGGTLTTISGTLYVKH